MIRDLHLYFPLFLVILGFVVVFLIGAAFHKFRKRLHLKDLGLALMVIGGFMSAILTFLIIWLPTPTEFAIMEHSLFFSKARLFSSISLQSNDEKTTKFFKTDNFEITRPRQIEQVVVALHTASPISPNNAEIEWSLILTMNTRKRHISMDVDRFKGTKSKNETILRIHKHMGTYRCDAMGEILEKILINRFQNAFTYNLLILPEPIFGHSGLTGSRFTGQHRKLQGRPPY